MTIKWTEEKDEKVHKGRRLVCTAGRYLIAVWIKDPREGYRGGFILNDARAKKLVERTFPPLGTMNLEDAKAIILSAARRDALERRDAAIADFEAILKADDGVYKKGTTFDR